MSDGVGGNSLRANVALVVEFLAATATNRKAVREYLGLARKTANPERVL